MYPGHKTAASFDRVQSILRDKKEFPRRQQKAREGDSGHVKMSASLDKLVKPRLMPFLSKKTHEVARLKMYS